MTFWTFCAIYGALMLGGQGAVAVAVLAWLLAGPYVRRWERSQQDCEAVQRLLQELER